MSKRKYPIELREAAVQLAAGQSHTAAAEQLALPRRAVSRWVQETDPAILARYIQEKRAIASRIVLEHTERAASRIMEDLAEKDLDHYQAKALQARATALGIMDDHYGGRQSTAGSTRFGTRDLDLAGWSDGDKLTLERIERVTLEPNSNSPLDPQG